MAVAKLKRVIKKKKQYEQIACSLSLFLQCNFHQMFNWIRMSSIHPSFHPSIHPLIAGQHTETNKPSHTHSHLWTLSFSQFASACVCLEAT